MSNESKTNKILRIDDKIWLSSGLKPEEFARTRLSAALDEKGVIAEIAGEKVNFTEYKFVGTKNIDNEIFFEGDFFDGLSLNSIFEGAEISCGKNNAFFAVEKALTAAICEDLKITSLGGEGIMVSKDAKKVLFLPGKLYEQCALCAPAVYSEVQGKFLNKALKDKDALMFTRSVIAYKALTGSFPFEKTDLSERQVDIYDNDFLPLSYAVNGINKNLSESIDNGLMLTTPKIFHSGKRDFTDAKKEARRKLILEKASAFNPENFLSELENKNRSLEMSEADFALRKEKWLSSTEKRLKIVRFTRRNKNRILAVLAVFVIGFWAGHSFYKENLNRASTKGLTPFESVQSLYTQINHADVPNLQEVVSGKKTDALIQIVSGYFITAKERLTTDDKAGTYTPGEWLLMKNKTTFWQYGITNLKLDGREADCNYDFPCRKDKKAALTEWNGKPLKNGDTTSVLADYYFIHSDGALIHVAHNVETVTLTWKGKCWLVTEITGKSDEEKVKLKDFKAIYQNILDANNGDFESSVASLREKYAWIPTDLELFRDSESVLEKYEIETARDFVNAHSSEFSKRLNFEFQN